MKLASTKDVETPIANVWVVMSDFTGWERAAMRRGVEVNRTQTGTTEGVGTTWQFKLRYRGKERKVEIKLTEILAPEVMAFAVSSSAVFIGTKVELIEMSAKRTRLHLVSEIKPRSFVARLFLQSLRLVRGKIERNFNTKTAQFAEDIEQRARNLGWDYGLDT